MIHAAQKGYVAGQDMKDDKYIVLAIVIASLLILKVIVDNWWLITGGK